MMVCDTFASVNDEFSTRWVISISLGTIDSRPEADRMTV
jgi:hypothetical protein